ncbi:MAG: hypothetical protein LCH46_04015 [Proteobacteria bacterium]|nr:hypothetical protein [Pseudomonadota bacterium]
MTMKNALLAAAAFVALSVPALAGETLTSKELRGLAPGRYAVSVMGIYEITVSIRRNGTITGIKGDEKDHGRWSVRGQKLCVAWNNWVGGKQRCASLSGGNGAYSGGGLYLRRI